MNFKDIFTLALGCMFLAACNGNSASNSGSGNDPVVYKAGVNIGNISTIPLGIGSSGQSTMTVTNNLSNPVTLQLKNSTYTGSNRDGTTTTYNFATTPNPSLNLSQCQAGIAAGGSCSIIINAPNNTSSGQFVLNLQFLDSLTNTTYQATNVVSFSDSVVTTAPGVRYSDNNATIYNEPYGNTTVTIPFQLTESFTSLSAAAVNNNPAFTPTISCPGNSYAAGTLCNLYVKISGTNNSPLFKGQITINATPATSRLSARGKALHTVSGYGATGYLFGVALTVVQNSTGNLLTSAVNLTINPANGNNPQVVTLLNNGSAAISGINVSAATPLTNTAACTSLGVGDSCTFNINANTNTSGQAVATLTYNNGTASGNLTFNVAYIAATPGPGLTLVPNPANLNNTPVDTSATTNITVTNSGNVTLSNISFTNPTTQNTAFSWGSGGSCSTTGTQVLESGNSCTLILQYSPKSTDSGVVNISAAGTYIDQGGNPKTYTAATVGVAYSAITGTASLYIIPNYVAYAIRADDSDYATESYSIVNFGLQSTTLDTLTIPTINGLSNPGGGTCTPGTSILAAGASCTFNLEFGPLSVVESAEAFITAGYKTTGSASSDTITLSQVYATSSAAALVSIESVVVTGASGTLPTLSYINAPLNPLVVTVTYLNSGTASASNFNVALNNLPVGFAESVVGTNCGVGTSVTTLNAESACTVSFYAVNPAGLYNPYALSGTGLGFSIPGFSYTDTNTGLNTMTYPTYNGYSSIAITTSIFASVTTTSPAWTTGTAGGTNNFTFTSSANGTQITIPSTSLGNLFSFTNNPCTISSGSCSIGIVNGAGAPIESYYFNYLVTESGLSVTPGESNSIVQQGSFSYSS